METRISTNVNIKSVKARLRGRRGITGRRQALDSDHLTLRFLQRRHKATPVQLGGASHISSKNYISWADTQLQIVATPIGGLLYPRCKHRCSGGLTFLIYFESPILQYIEVFRTVRVI